MRRTGSAAALALVVLAGAAAPARAQSGPPNLRGPWTLTLSVAGVAQFGSYETDYLDFGLSVSYSFYRALRARPPAPASAPAPAPAPPPAMP